MSDPRPIGVFDSGIGGLTVLKEIHDLLPDEELLYLGDTARVPYGSKSKETVIRYTLNNLRFLEGEGVKLVVVACNTASAYALPELAGHENPPVIGVIEGGVKAAAAASGRIGVIGTEATIKSQAYQAALAGMRPGERILARACPMFVPLAEEGWLDNHVARSVADEYLAQFRGKVENLVLGCTHYPLLKNVIFHALEGKVRLIDSAQETAKLVAEWLQKTKLMAPRRANRANIRFFVTDSPQRSMEMARKMLGDIGIGEAELVDIV